LRGYAKNTLNDKNALGRNCVIKQIIEIMTVGCNYENTKDERNWNNSCFVASWTGHPLSNAALYMSVSNIRDIITHVMMHFHFHDIVPI
jgi:hypothetical protein